MFYVKDHVKHSNTNLSFISNSTSFIFNILIIASFLIKYVKLGQSLKLSLNITSIPILKMTL